MQLRAAGNANSPVKARHEPRYHDKSIEELLRTLPRSPKDFMRFIVNLGKRRLWQHVATVLSEMRRASSLRLDVIALGAAVKACAGAIAWPASLQLVCSTEQAGVGADTFTLNLVLSSTDLPKKWRLALGILERQRRFLQPDIISYGSGSASCSRASHWSEVCRLYGQLSISGLEKDTTMLSTALTTFEKASQWERSLCTFWRVRREHQLRLDRHTFNAAASSCAAGLQPELAMRTMQDMKRLTIQPDVVTFGAMVTATEKSQLWQRATDLLQLSISQGMPLDVVLASSTISACEKALRWRWALGLAETLRCAHDLMPNEIMCNALISACASAGQWQLALCFLGEMPELELKPSTVSYNAAAEACQRALSWLGAVSILQDMRERTVQTDVITLSLIGAPCECSGQFGTLPSLVSSMLNYSRSRLQAQHAITAVEFLTDHACLQERVAKSFERFEWERLVNKLRELCAPTFAPLASERTSARLFDYELNQYFTLGAFFIDRTLGCFFGVRSPAWRSRGHVYTRRSTAERFLEAGTRVEEEASAHSLAAWISCVTGSAQPGDVGDGIAGGVFGYGSTRAAQSWLLPVNVQHDRSRHSERLALLCILRRELTTEVISPRKKVVKEEMAKSRVHCSEMVRNIGYLQHCGTALVFRSGLARTDQTH
ncbi:MRL1 [Symbiodinium necroappetens]|uniref:MRL1 protein n=1 Tax=Symbiodinium necroappetens TaxID=1628268 RepID=A0A812U2D0_9DINO|nr:MRL1 [Symbiodinium necroappetens]